MRSGVQTRASVATACSVGARVTVWTLPPGGVLKSNVEAAVPHGFKQLEGKSTLRCFEAFWYRFPVVYLLQIRRISLVYI